MNNFDVKTVIPFSELEQYVSENRIRNNDFQNIVCFFAYFETIINPMPDDPADIIAGTNHQLFLFFSDC